ncbi:Oidioi.mRNA.OKI2018_I69.chr2.g4992.t1.cds [Oikopleura dioica]|uniref:Oidioi.mRNA.OKI2018_I69.chr2.g4992.t1.cds n=1 Tax=Oikopleura dioica TaxID=34765 RepID=A0ABN7T5N7_OIKDI|nr:Oidioi.mRNA.OKI2018_I69.chr2.g4992.t1.cds [Oikopleura dioica]
MLVFGLFSIFTFGVTKGEVEIEKFLNFSSSSESSEDYSEVSDASSESSSDEPEEKGIRPDKTSDDETIIVKSGYCRKCERYGGVCIEDNVDSSFDSASDDEDQAKRMICSCKFMDCDPEFLDEAVSRPVCDQEWIIQELFHFLKTDEDYISSYSENPLDFYETEDYEEVILPKPTSTKSTTTTQKSSTIEAEILTTKEVDPGISEKDRTTALIIGIVEGLAFVTLVAVLTVSLTRS